MYEVVFPKQDKSLLRQNKEIQDAKSLMTPESSERSICLRQGNILIGYNYIEESKKWVEKWEQNLFNSLSLLPLDKYPWHVINNIFPNGPVILVKHPDGIQFYQADKANSMIHLVTSDKHFHDVYNLEVIWGSFYPDKNEFGLFTKNSQNEIKFYVIAKDSVWINTTYPVIPTDFNLSLRGAWLKQDTDYISNLIEKDFQDSIILRNYEGMEIYKFNNNYELELTISTKSIAKSKTSIEQMTFANLTNKTYRDILQLNNSGLYVYQYQSVTNDYALLAKSEAFSASNQIHLLDINNDGREEIIFTGSDGLTAIDFQKNIWTTILQSKNLLTNQLYGSIIYTMPQNHLLFIQDFEGNLQWAQIVASNISVTSSTTTELAPLFTAVDEINTNIVILDQIPRTSAKIKPILHLSEQWSADDLRNVFDEISGTIQFRLPLINLQPFSGWDIKLSLIYNSNLKSEGLLGVGYKNPFDLDCIVVNYPDKFPTVEQYFLIFKGQANQLERISHDDEFIKFKIEKYPATSPNLTISYNQNLETWFVESEEDKLVFGNAVNTNAHHALTSNFKWPNWQGPGTLSNADVLIQYVNAWYLNTHVNKISNQNLYYFYDMHFKSVNSNRKYVSEVNLKSIKDDDNFNLVFHYETKSQKPNFLLNHILMVPIPVIQSQYLVGYELDTKVVTQNVKFIYQSNDDILFLKSIQQAISGQTENELQLKYYKESILSSLRLKNGFETKFEFQSFHTPSNLIADKYIRPVMEQGIIRHGSDYAVITHKYKNQIIIQIYNKQMSEEIFKYINNIDSKILTVEVQAFDNFIIVDVMTESEIIIYIYNRYQNSWLRTPNRYSFHNKSIVRYNEMLIVVSEPSNKLLSVFSFNEGNWEQKKINLSQPATSIILNEKMIIIHANTDLKVFFRNTKDQWDSKLLKNDVKSLAHLLNKFDLSEEVREYYKSFFARNDLQVYNNLILLRVLSERNGQLLSIIYWFLLNDNYNIAEHGHMEHIQDDLLNLSIDRRYESIILYFGYVIENGYYKITVKNVGGEYLSNIKNSNRREDARIDLLEKFKKDMKETLKKTILLNLNMYLFQVNPEGVYIHNTLYRMTGTSFQTENVSSISIPLHKYFILILLDKKQEKMSLYRQNAEGKSYGNVLKEFKLFSKTYVIKYPFYIAVQTSHNLVEMLTFENDRTVGSTHYFRNEKLVFESTYENIITLANSTKGAFHSKLMEYIIRPIAGLVSPSIKQILPKEKIVRGGIIQRKTEYNYVVVKDIQNNIFSREVTVVPGGNKNIAGKITLSFSQNMVTKNITEAKCFYDSHDKLIKKQIKLVTPKVSNSTAENSNKELQKKEDEMKLLSLNKRFIISDNLPFQLSDEMFAYYGFEAYEKKQFGNKTCFWKNSQIIENSFSFTGQNYLHISNNGSFFEGSVQPKMQTITYLASCWIRTNVPLETNSAISFFKAIIQTSGGEELVGLFGAVKEQDGDWYYIELPIDFALVRGMYEEYMINTTSKTFESSETIKFVIILRILNTDYDFIDVDHIRFGPLLADIQVSVYHPFSGLLTAIIQNNGLVTRTIYNHFLEEMSDIDETGNVKQFVSKSKSGLFSSLLNIEPETGYYEKFDVFSLQSRWNVNNPSAWKVSQGQLWHCNIKTDQIELLINAFDSCSIVFRFYYTLESINASFKITFTTNDFLMVSRQNEHALLNINNKKIPLMGEFIIFIDNKYIHLWSEGQVVSETKINNNCINKTVKFDITSKVLIQDLFVLNRPSIRVEYNNIFGDVIQLIEYENTESVFVTAMLYDILGRKSITTKRSRSYRQPNQPILSYQAEFITNGEPDCKNSVWETGKLEGAVYKAHLQDQGFAYSRIEYFKNPLAEKKAIGLPGVEFSIAGTHSTKYATEFNPDFLNWQFPNSAGFTKQAEFAKNSNIRITVFDANRNKVALYSQLSNMNPILSTYEYDQENRLVKILPPQYHEEVKTVNVLSLYRSEDKYLSTKEKELQMKLGTHYHYNEFQQLFRKITPDAGIVLFLYNSAGYKRFMVHLNEDSTPHNVLYFDYNLNGRIIQTGRLLNHSTVSLDYLETIKNDPLTIATEDYQQFDYAEDHEDHKLRNRINNCITHFNGESVMENIVFNSHEQVTDKTAYSTLFYTENDQANNVRHSYINTKLYKTVYPLFQELQLVYLYNQLNEIIEQQLWNNSILIQSIKFSYRGDGQLEIENYQGLSGNMTRAYFYNSPGYLTRISDPFLTQDIAYTQNGYGEDNFDSKMVMQTIFHPTWERQDFRWCRITEDELKSKYAAICFKELKKHGYLNDYGLPMRLYAREKDFKLPLVCRGKTEKLISELIAQRYIPNSYGFNLAYGNYEELVAAKYFTDETEQFVSPLQENIFSHRIANLTAQDSTKIWKLLVNASYIQKLELNPSSTVGLIGSKNFFRENDLSNNLKVLGDGYIPVLHLIQKLIVSKISERKSLTEAQIAEYFMNWKTYDDLPSDFSRNYEQDYAKKIATILIEKNYMPDIKKYSSLETSFIELLKDYNQFIPDIVNVINNHRIYRLGESPFDLESFDIDANGNHLHFYDGYNRFEFKYKNGTNKISTININSETYSMQHDLQGNVVQAQHKQIEEIEYHPVSQRTMKILLTNGKYICYYYDARGERIMKKSFASNDTLLSEVFYVRDEMGRVLVDRRINYDLIPAKKVITAYVYGPRGLLGFYRNNSFFTVITDHIGSVRLIVNKGKVVAFYDYLPYGKLMRSFEKDSDSGILYRFTGQECDTETGLYNYHARLYDPTIGRFYQPDPKAQYFSPYKYAGNAPISYVDPDGQFAFIALLIIGIAGAAAGTYLGGAAVNNRWNPADWDFSDPQTVIGMLEGGISGALLPVGFAGSAAVIGATPTIVLGLASSYLSTAATFKNFNPLDWRWKDPKTFDSMFQGFAVGSSIAGGIKDVHNFANKLSTTKKYFFYGGTTIFAGGIMYKFALDANDGQWDWKNPGTYWGLVSGFDTAVVLPPVLMATTKGLANVLQNPKNIFSSKFKGQNKIQLLKSILRDPENRLYKTMSKLVLACYMGAKVIGQFDIKKWNSAVISTYQNILLDVYTGKNLATQFKTASEARLKEFSLKTRFKIKPKLWYKTFKNLINNIKKRRISLMIQKQIYTFFIKRDLILVTLKTIKKQTATINIRKFYDMGIDSWKQGKTKVPTELQDVMQKSATQIVEKSSQKLTAWDSKSNKQQKMYLDKNGESYGCIPASRIKRMDYLRQCILKKSTTEIFKKDPDEFIKTYPFTTKSLAYGLGNGKIQDYIFLREPGGYKLTLAPDYLDKRKVVSGYWLSTSGAGQFSNVDATVRVKAINPEVKVIFTGELQGCSIYARYDPKSQVNEFYHFNRPNMQKIYENMHEGQKLLPDKNDLVDMRGQNVKYQIEGQAPSVLSSKVMLVNANGNRITPNSEGVLTFMEHLYIEQNGFRKKIENMIFDGKTKSVDIIVENNRNKQMIEDALAEKYTTVISWEKYLGHPANYELLQQLGKFPFTFASPIIYLDNNKQWVFACQKLTYTSISSKDFVVDFGLHPPQKIVMDLEPNVKILSNPDVNFNPKFEQLLDIDLSDLKFGAQSSERRIRSLSSNKTIDSEQEFIKSIFYEKPAKSGSSQLQFGPLALLLSIINFIPNAWNSFYDQRYEQIHSYADTINTMPSQFSLLEFGDNWLQTTDFQGILTWGIFLVRKCTKQKRKAHQATTQPDSQIVINLMVMEIVDTFFDTISQYTEEFELPDEAKDVIDNSVNYFQAAALVREKLTKREDDRLSQILCLKIIYENLENILIYSNKQKTTDFLNKIKENLFVMNDRFIAIQQSYFNNRNSFEMNKVELQSKSSINVTNSEDLFPYVNISLLSNRSNLIDFT